MVHSADNFSIHGRESYERKEGGVCEDRRHREEEKHRLSESKSLRHKHIHHKHEHGRQHKKGSVEASVDEIASDVGDDGLVDPTQSDGKIEIVPRAQLEQDFLELKRACKNSVRVIDSMFIHNEQVELGKEIDGTSESQQKNLDCRFPGFDSRHVLDEEVEEGEILDEHVEVGDEQLGSTPADSVPILVLDQPYDDTTMKFTSDAPLVDVSMKGSERVKTDSKHDALSESRSVNRGTDKVSESSIGVVHSKEICLSVEKSGKFFSSHRCSSLRSKESERYFRHLQDRHEHGSHSMSRDIAHDPRHSIRNHDRIEPMSREVGHRSRHTDDSRRLWEAADDKRDSCVRYEERRSRSRDRSGRHEYADRRSAARIGRDCRDTIQSRSRGVHGEHIDRRRRSRSIESSRDRGKRRRSVSRSGSDGINRRSTRSRGVREHVDKRRRFRSEESSRDKRVNNLVSDRSGQNDYSERELRQKSEGKTWKEMDITMREQEDEDFQDSASLHSEDEDIDKEVEMIRIRRQAILEKHKNQEQLPGIRKLDLNVGLDAIFATGNAKVFTNGNASVASDCSEKVLGLDKGSLQNGLLERPLGAMGLGEGTPKGEEKSNDIFCDYIFGESPAGGQKQVKGHGLALETSGLADNWDDAEGYYCYRIGEILDGRYEIAASHGRGVFSSVVRAKDLKACRKDIEEVAIKIIRNNDVMLKSGQQELSILGTLNGADPENRRHCVRYITSFNYRKHLCLVFESMHTSLREVLKKVGRTAGLNLGVVQVFAKQLFIALKHLRNCRVLHCDIKPDNMLANEAKNILKLCDFGSAMLAGENEITPYLVSRFYRAPEIILGLPYDHPLDMWSVGCCLYEFFTGKVLFPGPTNNDMLRLHMQLKGPFPKKMLKKVKS